MHYYQFNIGDYQSHTSHLSEMEDLAYRRMLDWCYLHEKPLPIEPEEVARLVRMRSHSDCIEVVLQEFFERTENGWISARVNAEIHKVGEKSEKASASAKARWNKKDDANALPTQSDRYATHNTIPNTQDTKHKTQIKETAVAVCPINVDEQVWADFLSLRRTKKAPMTVTALGGIKREADKAGWPLEKALVECVARGWTGFNAEWVADTSLSKSAQQKASVISGLTRGKIGGGLNVKLLGN